MYSIAPNLNQPAYLTESFLEKAVIFRSAAPPFGFACLQLIRRTVGGFIDAISAFISSKEYAPGADHMPEISLQKNTWLRTLGMWVDVMKFAVAIPALNAAVRTGWITVQESYFRQSVQPALHLLADSGSTDSTIADAKEYGWEIMPVHRHDFNHGATRQKIVQKLAEAGFDAVVFAVQDACPATSDTIPPLRAGIRLSDIGVAVLMFQKKSHIMITLPKK